MGGSIKQHNDEVFLPHLEEIKAKLILLGESYHEHRRAGRLDRDVVVHLEITGEYSSLVDDASQYRGAKPQE